MSAPVGTHRFVEVVQRILERENERERLLDELRGSPDGDPDCGWTVWDECTGTTNQDRASDLSELLRACARALSMLVVFADNIGNAYTADDVGPRFACYEADALAMVMVEGGQEEAAARWLVGHGEGDDEGDGHHGFDEASALRYLRAEP